MSDFLKRFRGTGYGRRPFERVVRVLKKIDQDRCLYLAAALAYYLLFALFPFLLFILTLAGFFPSLRLYRELMASLADVLPPVAVQLIQDSLREVLSQQRVGLAVLGFFISLWSSSNAVIAASEGLNRAYGVVEERPFWKVRAMAILMSLSLSLLVITASVLALFGGKAGYWLAQSFEGGARLHPIWEVLRWTVSVGLMVVVLATVYYFVPDVEQAWRWITPGSIFAVLLWMLASAVFSVYVRDFATYTKSYGAIGAIIVLLTWFYITGFIVLLGGEINAELEQIVADGKRPGEKWLAEKHPHWPRWWARAKGSFPARQRVFSIWGLAGAFILSGALTLWISALIFPEGRHKEK